MKKLLIASVSVLALSAGAASLRRTTRPSLKPETRTAPRSTRRSAPARLQNLSTVDQLGNGATANITQSATGSNSQNISYAKQTGGTVTVNQTASNTNPALPLPFPPIPNYSQYQL